MFWERHHKDIFDWNKVQTPEADAIAGWLRATDPKDRQFPLQVALQVHSELEQEMITSGRMDDARLREIRGGMKALKRFALTYETAITAKPKKADEQ